MKSKKQTCYILLLQTVVAYIFTILMLHNSFNSTVLFKIDIFLFLLIWLGLFFISSHFIFPIKRVYQFLYEKRYPIALILLAILVLGKFNGSSYGMYNSYVEPNYSVPALTPIFGTSRAIRSDGWLVNSAYVLSQIKTGFHYFNPLMRGVATDVFATLPAPVFNILGLTKPFVFGYVFLGNDYGMAFYWFGRIIALFLVTFELLMVLSKGKKVSSLIGTILITASPPVFWWYSTQLIEILVGGEFAVLMFYHFLREKNWKRKVLYSILIGWGFLVYAFALYPAWQIPFGYVFLLLAFYLLLDAKKQKPIRIKTLWPILLTVVMIVGSVGYFLYLSGSTYQQIMSTVYPGARFVLGGTGYGPVSSYPLAIFFPYFDAGNPSELSSFYSFFPLVLIVAIYYLIRERKHWKENILLLGLTVLTIIYLIFAVLSFPSFLAKITLMYMVPAGRLGIIISFLCILLFTLLLDKKLITTKKEKIGFIVLLVLSSLYTINEAHTVLGNYATPKRLLIGFLLLIIPSFYFLFHDKMKEKRKTNRIMHETSLLKRGISKVYIPRKVVLLFLVTAISFVTTIYVNPLMKGFSALDEKPLSKELKKYGDTKDKWVALDSIVVANYLGTQGKRVINSTNIYPNLAMWKKLDPKMKYKDIYNRYAHVNVELTKGKLNFKLTSSDLFTAYLNPNDLCKLDVDFLTSYRNLDEYNQGQILFDEKYHKDNLYLYQVNCKES